ncbi:MCP four helix bundle domain-containing protein [Pedobacter sp. ASV12]|uniref:MCP four helix bundle domain-containing protein n=1 Tax=Pedobacter sp. ASV12 TaxID=2795120 RepID=UPI0018ECDB7B|nr:MCP four helix bundle domain-containing protein [Pedobacter sp. ASV12]
MKFSYSLKQKTKIALLLFCIMACTILIRVLEDKSIKDMGTSFVSMYNDRLVPATDLFMVAEKVHAKRHLLASHTAMDLQQSKNIDQSIDSLLDKYAKTFLVKSEKSQLQNLKNSLAQSLSLIHI